jgi:hypothetical protein
MIELVRYSPENQNPEATKGKWGSVGEPWGKITVVKNVVCVIAYKGAKVSGYAIPTVYDGFLQCSDGSTVPVTDSRVSLDLDGEVSAFGLLQLKADN